MTRNIISLEQEVRDYLVGHSIQFQDFSYKPTTPDFGIFYGSETTMWLEVKEKRQRIKKINWPATDTPEEYLFILDELTARRLLLLAPYAGVIVRDNTTWRYTFISVLNLWLMPKLRVNRRTSDKHLKGKWLLDMRNGVISRSFPGALKAFYEYAHNARQGFEMDRCVGRYVGETVNEGGELRTEEMRLFDLLMTR